MAKEIKYDVRAREAILKIHLSKKGLKTRVPYARLVELTVGYSGREIERICRTAVKSMVDRHNAGLIAAVDAGRAEISDYELKVAPLTADDFDAAFAGMQPETTERDLEAFARWKNQQDT